MRKIIKSYIFFNLLLWSVTIIIFIASTVTNIRWGMAAALFLGVFMMLFTLFLSTRWTWKGLDKDWFKTQEQLQKDITEQKESWEKAHKLIRILGEHEAIKLWNTERDKKEAQS